LIWFGVFVSLFSRGNNGSAIAGGAQPVGQLFPPTPQADSQRNYVGTWLVATDWTAWQVNHPR